MPTITITTDNALTARLATALGKQQGFGRDATAAEVKAYLIDHIRQIVWRDERREVAPVPFDPT